MPSDITWVVKSLFLRFLPIISRRGYRHCTNLPQVEVGIRPGEKLHEEMITVTDALDTIDLGRYYVILPSVSFKHSREEFIRHHNAVPVPDGFHYSSDNNTEWETVETMRENIKKYVDPNFEVNDKQAYSIRSSAYHR